VLSTSALQAEESFSYDGFYQAKKIMYKAWSKKQETFYCGCHYDRKKRGNNIDRKSCGYLPKKENKSSNRIEAEHVVPYESMYRNLACSEIAKDKNINSKNLTLRQFCYKTDDTFRKFHDDPHNLVPSIGELNQARSNYIYGDFEPQSEEYGGCNFEVDAKLREVYISDVIKGDVARIYGYVSKKYGYEMSDEENQKFRLWHVLDPVDTWELERNQRIDDILKKIKSGT
jgi:deoxyribonuclease I